MLPTHRVFQQYSPIYEKKLSNSYKAVIVLKYIYGVRYLCCDRVTHPTELMIRLRTLKYWDFYKFFVLLIKAKTVRVGEWYRRVRLQHRTTADNYNESDLEVNVAAVILEVFRFDHVNKGREDRVRCVLDALQQRPQPVDDDLALRVEEHEHVASRGARARQPRPRHAHADVRRPL